MLLLFTLLQVSFAILLYVFSWKIRENPQKLNFEQK